MPMRLTGFIIVIGALVSACSSAPVNYHTLVPVQPRQDARSQVRIERVSVPPQVDRQQIVVRQGNSGLAILETEWWGANLADEFRSALQDQLGGGAGGNGASILRVDVQRFDSVPGQQALIDVRWRLLRSGSAALTCRSLLSVPAGTTVDSLVKAHQENVRRLAEQIVRTDAGVQGGCPREVGAAQ